MKRSNYDFKDHELIVEKNDLVMIHHLKKPDTIAGNIKFINCGGVLSVTGDYGNWIFCREFHPYSLGYVNDNFWLEKLKISSDQTGLEYDREETIKTLNTGIHGGLADYGYEGDELLSAKTYYRELFSFVDCGEREYEHYAYGDNRPDFIDTECVPYEQKTQLRLKIIFDGFEEVCSRMKE